MLPLPDPRTVNGQLRICCSQAALAVSALGCALNLLAQVQETSDAALVMGMLEAAQAHIAEARAAAFNFAGMVLPCAGSI